MVVVVGVVGGGVCLALVGVFFGDAAICWTGRGGGTVRAWAGGRERAGPNSCYPDDGTGTRAVTHNFSGIVLEYTRHGSYCCFECV